MVVHVEEHLLVQIGAVLLAELVHPDTVASVEDLTAIRPQNIYLHFSYLCIVVSN